MEIGVPEESVETPEPLAYVPEPPAAEEPAAEEPAGKEPVAEAAAPEPLPVDEETAHLTWRTDKPGLPVKNIRSGISLYDRALFIGTLFKEDYALYDKTIGELNALDTLDEAVDYLLERFPDWNLKSDIVYNFMMAVRKKLG